MARVPSYMDLPTPVPAHVPAPLTGRVTDVSEGLVGITYTDPATGTDTYVEAPASPGQYAPGAPVIVPAPGSVVAPPITLPTVEGLVEVGPAPDGPGTALGGRLGSVEAVQGNLQDQLAAASQTITTNAATVAAQLNELDNALAAAQGTAQTARNEAEAAHEAANAAQNTAASAAASASQATSAAQSAQNTAAQARNTATQAQGAAGQAQNTATQAHAAAQNASSVAGTALSKANTAQDAANTAHGAANAAQGTANTARSTANNALAVAQTGSISTARLFAGAQKIGGALIGQNAIGAEHVVASKAFSAKVGQFLEVTTSMLTAGNATVAGTAVVGTLRGNTLDGGEVIVRNQSPVAPASYTGGWSARPVTTEQAGAAVDPKVTVTPQAGGWRIHAAQQDHALVELTANTWFPPIPPYGEVEIKAEVTMARTGAFSARLNEASHGAWLDAHPAPHEVTLTLVDLSSQSGRWNQRLYLRLECHAGQSVDATVRITSIRVRQRGSGTAHLGRDQYGQAVMEMTTSTGEQVVRIHVEGDDEGTVELRGRIISPDGDTHTEVKLNSHGIDYTEDGAGKPFVLWSDLAKLVEAIKRREELTQRLTYTFTAIAAGQQKTTTIPFDAHGYPLDKWKFVVDGNHHPRVGVGVENVTPSGLTLWCRNYTTAAVNIATTVTVHAIPPLDL